VKKPLFRRVSTEFGKCVALWYTTEEMLADIGALDQIAAQELGDELRFMLEDSIINGTGAGQPLGILNSGALLVQPTSGGGAGTIKTPDVFGIFSKLMSGAIARGACWLCHPSVFPQLFSMAVGTVPVFVPTSVANAPFGTLLGLPIVPVEQCAPLGTLGDLLAVDLSQYVVIDNGAPRTTQSVHIRFLAGEVAFRTTLRVNGQPFPAAPVTAYKGGGSQSAFVAFTSTRT
jgi:HK97 family phage major capsid protein